MASVLTSKNWVKKLDANGAPVLDEDGEPVLEQVFSIDTGTVLTINTKTKKLYNEDESEELCDISAALTPQKLEFIRAKAPTRSCSVKSSKPPQPGFWGLICRPCTHRQKRFPTKAKVLLRSKKSLTVTLLGSLLENPPRRLGCPRQSQYRRLPRHHGLMTSQELEMMAATVISPTVDGSYQSGCHTASVWDKKARRNIPKLMNFMNKFGLITARDPDNEYHPMTDVIHKVLNDITVDDWSVIIGGDSHTRMSKGVAFGADSGTVALH